MKDTPCTIGTGGVFMFKKKTIGNPFRTGDFMRRCILAWLLASAAEYLMLSPELRDLSGTDGLAQMSFARWMGITFGVVIFLTVISRRIRTGAAERVGMLLLFAVLSVAACLTSATGTFLAICLFLLAVLSIFVFWGWDDTSDPVFDPKPANKIGVWVTVLSAVFVFLLVCAWTVGKVYSFSSPTFDFGIFSQMFHHMKKSGLPLTTLERDGLLSHFAVHVSPIYYLMLPFYRLVPSPATLQVLQAAVITSAVIPLWKIGKHHGLSGVQRMLICAVLLLYPAYTGGTSYDLHENCFLTPLILWLFYGIDRKKPGLVAVCAALTLAVKEDAAVYVAVIALWLIVKTVLRCKPLDLQNLITGISLLAVSLIWFLLVTGYLSEYGDGVMTDRYSNFMYNGSSSLFTVVKSVLLHPMKAIYECADTEKLYFIVLMLLPLLGLPLVTRRYERYILLIPYILVNLMSDYPYQHDIFFQYTFGSIAFLVYLTVVNLADFKNGLQRTLILIASVMISAVFFSAVIVPKAVRYPMQAIRDYGYYESLRDALDIIPEDASVTATTFYTVYLSQRDTLYDIQYCSIDHLLETEYIVLNASQSDCYQKYATGDGNNGYENFAALLETHGYAEVVSIGDTLVIWHKQ